MIDLSDLINATPVAKTADEAATYYRKGISTAPRPGL